jgi:putative ferrous iron transport protein C
MILSDIKRYLQEHRQASLSDLSLHFDTTPDAMRGMLEQWIHKGRVSRTILESGCHKSCSACSCHGETEIYAWRA